MNKPGSMVRAVEPRELYDVMCGAASQDPAVMERSAFRLKGMLETFGAYDALQEIAAQKTGVPLQVRQQSIIQFKNAALNHWRTRKFLSDDHRVRIRARCLELLDEPDDIIAGCNEVIVAKMARMDLPNNWPNLVPELKNMVNFNLALRSNSAVVDPRSTLILIRSLRLLNQILKEFASMKMLQGIGAMTKLVEVLCLVFYAYYSKLGPDLASLDPQSISLPRTAEDLTIAHLVFKCLVKMTTWTWNRSHKQEYQEVEPWIREFFQNSAAQLRTLSELRINLILALRSSPNALDPISRRSVDQLSRHVRLFGKLFRRLQQLDTKRFVALPTSSDIVFYYWSKVVQAVNSPSDFIADSDDAVFPVRFIVQAMVLFKESLAQWAPVRKDGLQNDNVLPQAAVEDAVKLLITCFIPLNSNDLEAWVADPDQWINEENKEDIQWEFEVRPCAERVLMTLAGQYKQYVVPLLESTFKQVVSQPTTNLPSIIQKEAIYCAIGRCASRLKDVIPFNQWLDHTLVPESQENNPNYPIVKRRIAWLLGKWISDGCAPADNPKVWQVLVHLLQDRGPGSDTVVCLTAVSVLRECIDTVEFNPDVFAPFLPAAVKELLTLLAETDNPESKCRIVNSLNTVVERAEKRIVPLLEVITGPLPGFWTDAGDDWTFKAALLTTAEKLLQSSREHSNSLHGFVVALIRECFSAQAQLSLEDDGLNVWQVALRNALTIEGANKTPCLLDLFPLAISLQQNNPDLRSRVINIIESYLILDASRILQLYALDLFRAYEKSMPELVSGDQKALLITLQLLSQIAPSYLWGEALHVSGLFAALLKPLINDDISFSLLMEHIYVLARIAVVDRQIFLHLMSAAPPSFNKPESELWESLLDQWWSRFDSMSEPRHRKLAAMGVANLVSTGRPEVLHRLSTEIFNLWMDVFCELKEAQDQAREYASEQNTNVPLTLYWDRDEPSSSYYAESEGTPEYDRRKAIFDNDVIRTTQLTTFISARLQEAELAVGGGQTLQMTYLSKADPLVLKQIQDYLIGG